MMINHKNPLQHTHIMSYATNVNIYIAIEDIIFILNL